MRAPWSSLSRNALRNIHNVVCWTARSVSQDY
jgi:hypothetical protein